MNNNTNVFVGRRCIGMRRWAASATVCRDRAASERVGTSCRRFVKLETDYETVTTPPPR